MLRASAKTIPIHFALAYIARNYVKKAYLIDRDKQCKEYGYSLLRYIYAHYRFFGERAAAGKDG
ncbi:hypothetical protein GCX98_04285 [Salmonella enterica subsp. diarizonae]|uniref:Uncharacterized protein n=3 Tax=Salmonella enterica TaxID=28901 RepID=A0A3U0GSJ9_SALDZ|nr:hypothetical protein [Salmonella enterica]EAA2772101.1 hypothetical protein [Salmonella enterica subsp. diarizonae]EBQ4833575.1 hypothetical protein [Salmonella enterica subsp. arizonae]EDT4350253.1 hypothetical protein [Salmonella enterica subsp. diarizonae serovar 50:k:z]EDU6309545.1 hypothetical protein [Salmonella enterica subsp. diarizonae serovar 53:z10:z]EDW6119255.1 hypothetical protein [Salmonella enterica subsp. salamae]EED8463352.1 hypothetical protein [Salmonella enterica subsp